MLPIPAWRDSSGIASRCRDRGSCQRGPSVQMIRNRATIMRAMARNGWITSQLSTHIRFHKQDLNNNEYPTVGRLTVHLPMITNRTERRKVDPNQRRVLWSYSMIQKTVLLLKNLQALIGFGCRNISDQNVIDLSQSQFAGVGWMGYTHRLTGLPDCPTRWVSDKKTTGFEPNAYKLCC